MAEVRLWEDEGQGSLGDDLFILSLSGDAEWETAKMDVTIWDLPKRDIQSQPTFLRAELSLTIFAVKK